MAEQLFDLGEIEVFIMGKPSALINIPQSTAEQIVVELTHRLSAKLEDRFGGKFSFEIISIRDGCMKAKLKLMWFVAVTVAAGIADYPNLKAGANELWCDATPIIRFVVGERTCEAGFSKEQLIGGLHGPINEGETLSQIVNELECGTYSKEQVMVAVYMKNPGAFHKNMNRLKKGAVLQLPRLEEFGQVSAEKATEILECHNKEFYNK